mgnify:CR=1 FL=1
MESTADQKCGLIWTRDRSVLAIGPGMASTPVKAGELRAKREEASARDSKLRDTLLATMPQ